MIEIWIHLFGKPEWEMDLEKAKAKDFEELGKKLFDRLKWVSQIILKLEANNWERSAGLYDIHYYKETTLKKAKSELKKNGICEKEVNIEEVKWE